METTAPAPAPEEKESSWFSMPKMPSFGSSATAPEVDASGNPVEKKPWYSWSGGKRRSKKSRMRGGSFSPFIARSIALNASPFKGGRKRKSRRTRKSKKGTKRHRH